MNVTSIVDFSQEYLQVTNEGQVLLIKKSYCNVQINPTNPNLVDFRFHWYELNSGQRLFYLDFNIIVAPVTASAAALLTAIQGFLTSQFGGSVANASETVKGIVEEATQAEVNAYTDTGATGAQLFVVPSKLKVWIEQAALTIDAIWHFVSAKLRLFNAAKTFYVAFTTPATANRSQAFQDANGTIALTSDIPAAYTDEQAQDAVGTILVDSTTIDFTYSDATPSITAIVIDDSITNAKLANMANSTIKGRTTAGAGDPEDLTAAQARSVVGQFATMSFFTGQYNAVDATNYYFGTPAAVTPGTTADKWYIKLPYDCTIIGGAASFAVVGTLGTTETSTVYLRINGSNNSFITGTQQNAAIQSFTVTGLSIAYTAGQTLEILWTTPTYVTNPTGNNVRVDIDIIRA